MSEKPIFTVGSLRRLLQSVHQDKAYVLVTLVSEDGAHHPFRLTGFEVIKPDDRSTTRFEPYLDLRIGIIKETEAKP